MRSLAWLEVSDAHTLFVKIDPNLDILQCQVLGLRTPVDLELRLHACDHCKEISNSQDNGVHIEINVITGGKWVNIVPVSE